MIPIKEGREPTFRIEMARVRNFDQLLVGAAEMEQDVTMEKA
jgi:hypothetical protein